MIGKAAITIVALRFGFLALLKAREGGVRVNFQRLTVSTDPSPQSSPLWQGARKATGNFDPFKLDGFPVCRRTKG